MGEWKEQRGFADCPFAVAVLSGDGRIVYSNAGWQAHSPPTGVAWEALGLVGPERDDFSDAVKRVSLDRIGSWIDVDIPVLGAKRWARCHLWPSDNDHDDGHGVVLAVTTLRETHPSELSRIELEHVERILEHTADAIAVVKADGTVAFASGIANRLLGMSGSEYEGMPAVDIVFEDDRPRLETAFTQCIENPRKSIKSRFRIIHESGDLIWVEGIGTNMFDDPAIQGILVALNDITELVETRAAAESNEVALGLEKQRYETLAQFMPTGVFELDQDNAITFSNERFDQLLGFTEQAQGSLFPWSAIDHRDRARLVAAFEQSRNAMSAEATIRLSPPESSRSVQQWLTIRAVSQDGTRLLGSVDDATSQITKQTELEHRADHDDLTGLPNRNNLLEQLQTLTAAGEHVGVLFLDLDNFKDINDALGHRVGDRVLVEVAERIRSVVRPSDIVGRLHGDEFLVLCRQASQQAVVDEIASRVVRAVARPLTATTQNLVVSGSIGIAMSSGSDTTAEQLLVDADLAMYEAKRRGGARWVPFTTGLADRADDRLRLHGDIQRAAELDEFVVHYQPIIDLKTNQVIRREAMVRWQHPVQGLMLPERFIPDIERTELIDELGRWVLDHVVQTLAKQDDPLPVNVNVSPHQFKDQAFASKVLDVLDKYQVPGRQLALEITELISLDAISHVENQLHLLRSNGVAIVVDDFGTGYSALTYLQRFPFDQIKIDGAFIDKIDSSPTNRSIVRSIVELVASLGAIPIAEKVERLAQVETLIELECPLAQGFLLGKPAPESH